MLLNIFFKYSNMVSAFNTSNGSDALAATVLIQLLGLSIHFHPLVRLDSLYCAMAITTIILLIYLLRCQSINIWLILSRKECLHDLEQPLAGQKIAVIRNVIRTFNLPLGIANFYINNRYIKLRHISFPDSVEPNFSIEP